MKFLLRPVFPVLFSCLLAVPASAHPGHGEPGPFHYLTSVDHLGGGVWLIVAALVAGLAIARAARYGQRWFSFLVLRFVGGRWQADRPAPPAGPGK